MKLLTDGIHVEAVSRLNTC